LLHREVLNDPQVSVLVLAPVPPEAVSDALAEYVRSIEKPDRCATSVRDRSRSVDCGSMLIAVRC
jgi:hypothetical protein